MSFAKFRFLALAVLWFLIVGLFALKHIVLDGWMPFLMGVAVYTAIYCLLMYVFAMNDYERDIIRKPLGKILNRFHR